MGIYIKGVRMPKCCGTCVYYRFEDLEQKCFAKSPFGRRITNQKPAVVFSQRDKKCPLRETGILIEEMIKKREQRK